MNLAELTSQIAAHQDLVVQLIKLETLREKTAIYLAELSAHCDLADEASLLKVARLQALASLLPARIEARRQEHLKSTEALSESFVQFVTGVLSANEERAIRALRAITSQVSVGQTALTDPDQLSGPQLKTGGQIVNP